MKEQPISKSMFGQYSFSTLKEIAKSIGCEIIDFNHDLYVLRFEPKFEGDLTPVAHFGYMVANYENSN